MTISNTIRAATINGNGTAGPFLFGFRFLANSDITVTKINSQGASLVLIEDANYTLTGAGGYAGGTVTLNSPLAVGETLQLVRTVSELQPIDLRNQGGFFPEVMETALDRLTMVVQQRGGSGGDGSDAVDYPDVFYPYVLSGMALNWTAGGTELTISAGRYYSDGRLIDFTGAIIAIQPVGYMDIYLDSAGGVVIEAGDNYWKLAGYVDKLKVARIINSGVNTIQGVLDWRLTSPTPKQPVQGAFHADSVMQTFDIPETIAPWTAHETIFYGDLRENSGRIYQAFTHGLTGGTAPTDMPSFWDAGLGVYIINDGGVKWAYFADSPYKGAFRYGQNNGILWYFVFSGLLSIADYNPSRIKALLNCAIKHIVVPWLSGVAVVVGNKRIANHNVYECTQAGTTGVAAPSGTGAGITDGTATWMYLFKNPGDYPSFTAGEQIADGDLRVANGDIWKAATVVTHGCGPTLPNRSTNATGGTFTDNSITWSWMRANAPGGWKYYWYDTLADMSRYRTPDSHDSYASMFVALACAYVNNTMDFAWFDTTNAAGETNYATMKNLMYYNVLTQIKGYAPWAATTVVKFGDEYTSNGTTYRCILSGTTGTVALSGTIYGAIIVDGTAQWQYVNPTYTGLTRTFQNDFTGDHGIWGTSYLMDNCEVYAGLRALIAEMTARGDGDTAYYSAFLSPLSVGVGLFYQTSSKEWNWSTTNLISDEIGSEWYPSCMAGLFPELYQVPVGTTPEICRVKWNHGWEKLDRDQPSWWGRNIDAFPTLMPAYLAARYRGEIGKALEAVEKAKRLHLRQGFSPLGTMFIVDAAFMIAIQRLAVNSAYATEQAPAMLEAQQMLKLGSYYLWIDGSGNLRKKNGKPSGLTDGTII